MLLSSRNFTGRRVDLKPRGLDLEFDFLVHFQPVGEVSWCAQRSLILGVGQQDEGRQYL
jgi:hypothetical protein